MTLPPDDERKVEGAAERAVYAAVDGALRSFPLWPAPQGLAPAVMAALHSPDHALAARPVFRVIWMDFALSGFAALMLSLLLLLSGWLPPEAAARLRGMVAAPLFQTDVLVWALAGAGLIVTAGLLLVAGLVFRRPAPLERL